MQIAAERAQNTAQTFWSRPSFDGSVWQPLTPELVHLVPPWNFTGVLNRAGGGTFAVRWPMQPVNLRKTPVMRLPFRLKPGACVNMHIQVSGKGYLIPLTAPVDGTPFVLCPAEMSMRNDVAFLRSESQTQLPPEAVLAPAESIRGYLTIDLLEALGERAGDSPLLESLIIGNTSNKDYLLAGFAANKADAEYRVGIPMWFARSE